MHDDGFPLHRQQQESGSRHRADFRKRFLEVLSGPFPQIPILAKEMGCVKSGKIRLCDAEKAVGTVT